jgi:predicted CXXCH cytochrome family protein
MRLLECYLKELRIFMNKQRMMIVSILFMGLVVFAGAQETKEIPDHSAFNSCSACHAAKDSMWLESGHGQAIRKIVAVNPAATDCIGCHALKSPTPTQTLADSKESHHKISCLACHKQQKTEFIHKLVMDPEKLCLTCHTQNRIFLGLGAKGIEDSRNFHSGVPCVLCHMSEGNHRMKVIRPDDPGVTDKRTDTCTASCHKDRAARIHQIQEWQSSYDEAIKPILADIKMIEEALTKKPTALKTALKSKFEDVKANLAILQNDGSRGFHNIDFSLEVMALATADIKTIKAAIK